MTPRWSETALSPASFPGVSFSIDCASFDAIVFGSRGSFYDSMGLAVEGKKRGPGLKSLFWEG